MRKYTRNRFLHEITELSELYYNAIDENDHEDIKHYKEAIINLLNKVEVKKWINSDKI